ncbi:hypothetical protein [Pontibacter sp. G13]|uniref:hypothetical protein n=1 Tax=Pontibacter sp. G13 TaxID=3074898 RepID=UPI0028899141|nr:hypothetical protein [Pontibacter sp. G13]WNJ17381.1 hypothetical protein RJD25_21240 [Pontibacter sp. G13]
MKQILNTLLKSPVIVLLVILTNSVYLYMLIKTIPEVQAFADQMPLLDMKPKGYDQAYVIELFTKLGEEGRSQYRTKQIPVDMIYPGLFAICYAALMAFLLQGLNLLKGAWRLLILFPIIAGICDYVENFGILRLLDQFPDLSSDTVTWTQYASIGKSAASTVSFILLMILVMINSIRWLREKRSHTYEEPPRKSASDLG